jgi:hypothetical protein
VNLSAEEFGDALDALLIVWRRGDEPLIGPLTDPATERVAAYVEHLLNNNPALLQVVHQRFSTCVEVAPGVLVLPVASIRHPLEHTARHKQSAPIGAA